MIPPIVILGNPRSGSSLVCAMLKQQGVWFGSTGEANPKYPFGTLENQPIRKALVQTYNPWISEFRIPFNPDKEWAKRAEGLIRADGYNDGPWAIKHSIRFWPTWLKMNVKWVLVYRPIDDVMAGLMRKKGEIKNPKKVGARLFWNQNQMHQIVDKYKGHLVVSDNLIKRQHSEAQKLFDYVGLKNVNIEESLQVIRPELWGK